MILFPDHLLALLVNLEFCSEIYMLTLNICCVANPVIQDHFHDTSATENGPLIVLAILEEDEMPCCLFGSIKIGPYQS